jgi:hypothetical protein
VHTTPANVRDEQPLLGMLKGLPEVEGPGGRPWPRPISLLGDRGYGFPWINDAVSSMGICSLLDPRGGEHGSGLGRWRYVVERTFAWFGHWRRVRSCYEKTAAHWQAYNELTACMICYGKLRHVTEGL